MLYTILLFNKTEDITCIFLKKSSMFKIACDMKQLYET
jgi:hypothetical protein